MAAFQAFGLNCPDGGKFYICDKATVQFIGCCTSDPCADGSGKCPSDGLRTSSFSGDSYHEIPEQDCDANEGRNIWYTCSAIKPTFMGCCRVNPCVNKSCPRDSLVPARLSEKDLNRNVFLNPTSPVSSTAPSPTSSVSSKATSSPTSGPSGTAVPNTNGGDQQTAPATHAGLSTGAIVGIALGIGGLVIILIALLMYKFGWSAAKRRERKKAPMLAQPMAQSPDYDPNEPAPYYDNKSAGQPSPYRDSYMSGSTAFSSPRSTMFGGKHQMRALSPADETDPRHPSPAYSQHGGHSRTPSGGGAATNLPIVYEMDSAQIPIELASNPQSGHLHAPYPTTAASTSSHELGNSRDPSFETPMVSPGLPSDSEAGYGSPMGSPGLPSPRFSSQGYTSVSLTDQPQYGQGGYPNHLHPGPRH